MWSCIPTRSAFSGLLLLCGLLLVLTGSATALHKVHSNPQLLVRLPGQGSVLGHLAHRSLSYSPEPRTVAREWLGIPYAAAPVGDLRFEPPAVRPPWEDTLLAETFPPSCLQGNRTDSPVKVHHQSEDCLQLNVWSPLEAGEDAALPVMVFLPGGAFISGGSGSPKVYYGINFAAADIVMVSLNYRLGPLGFLSHPALPHHNLGLLDQMAAFQWVHKYIHLFGGDPNNLILVGNSAGSLSGCVHAYNPLIKGMFDRMILSSGPCTLATFPMETALAQGVAVAEALGCGPGAVGVSSTSDPLIAKCLKALDGRDIWRESKPKQVLLFGEGYLWGPVVDGRVLLDQPYRLLRDAEPNPSKLLIGSNLNEGTAWGFMKFPVYLSEAHYHQLLEAQFGEQKDAVARLYSLPEHAYGCQMALSEVLGDLLFTCGVRHTARAMHAKGVRSYAYLFSYVPTKLMTSMVFGAHHGLDNFYVFHNAHYLKEQSCKDMSAQMIAYWVGFIKHGDPNAGRTQESPYWHEFEEDTQRLMMFDYNITHEEKYRKDRCDVLDIQLEPAGVWIRNISMAQEPTVQYLINMGGTYAVTYLYLVSAHPRMVSLKAWAVILSIVVVWSSVFLLTCRYMCHCWSSKCGRKLKRQ